MEVELHGRRAESFLAEGVTHLRAQWWESVWVSSSPREATVVGRMGVQVIDVGGEGSWNWMGCFHSGHR